MTSPTISQPATTASRDGTRLPVATPAPLDPSIANPFHAGPHVSDRRRARAFAHLSALVVSLGVICALVLAGAIGAAALLVSSLAR